MDVSFEKWKVVNGKKSDFLIIDMDRKDVVELVGNLLDELENGATGMKIFLELEKEVE